MLKPGAVMSKNKEKKKIKGTTERRLATKRIERIRIESASRSTRTIFPHYILFAKVYSGVTKTFEKKSDKMKF